MIHVVAGVVRDASGRILLAERPAGKHLAGLWEFPGGKCEPDEAPFAALARELHEELGIDVAAATPLIAVPHRYSDRAVLLDVWTVDAYSGEPHSRESQALRWTTLAEIDAIAMPEADRPVIAALRLPDRYLVTPEPDASDLDGFLASLDAALRDGHTLIQLRAKSLDRDALWSLALRARDACRAVGAQLLINDDVALARELDLDLDGVHLSAAAARTFAARPLEASRRVAMSCHDADELRLAAALGADFATLSPVAATATHPDARPLGWTDFAVLCREAALPVYALGGLGPADVAAARLHGARGVAAIRAFWPAR